MSHIIQDENQYCAHNYAPLPVVLTKGKGIHVWDEKGKCYIDMMSAYSAVSHGHAHPALLQVLIEQAQSLAVVSRAFYTDQLAPFLKRATTLSGFDKALPMNTGAEAVETALKAARKWAYTVKGVPHDQAQIIACENNFHGRTIAIVGMSTEPQYQSGFGPFPPGLKTIAYGDAGQLEAAITPNTAAFIVEPVQGEAGIIVPPAGYLRACSDICKKHRVLFICDEIQTGLGRTGRLFAYQHENIQPDALILGKALGGGLLPVSLFLAQNEVMDVFTPGDHGSTFGGNPLAAAVALKALEIIVEERLSERAAELGDYFAARLKAIAKKSSVIQTVRGKGLLIGLEINPPYNAHDICLRLMQAGVLTKETHATVIRLAPPLIITKAEIDNAASIIDAVITDLANT